MKRYSSFLSLTMFSTGTLLLFGFSVFLLTLWTGRCASAASSTPKIPVRLGADSLHAGNLYIQETDFELPSSMGLALYLARSYNSRSERSGFFGLGWVADPIDICIHKGTAGQLILLREEGNEDLFSTKDGVNYIPTSAVSGLLRLSRLDDGKYLLLLTSGEQWTFNAKGYLVSKTDPLGNRLIIERSDDGITPESLIGPIGEVVRFSARNNGNVLVAEGPGGLRVTYGFDEKGRVSKKTTPVGQESIYEYGSDGRLRLHRVLGGNAQSFLYSDGLLARHTIEGVGSRAFRYTELSWGTGTGYRQEIVNESDRVVRAIEIRNSGRERIEIDDLGNQIVLRFDEAGRLVGRKGPIGLGERWKYTPNGFLEAYDDIRGNQTQFEWAFGGYVVTMTDPRRAKTIYQYDLAGILAAITDPWGIVTRYVRDDHGRVTEVFYDNEKILTQEFNEQGYIKAVSGIEGSWTYERDSLGNILSVVDGEGRKVVKQSDKLGRPTFLDAGEGRTLTWFYDEMGRLTSITDGQKNRQEFSFTSNGSLAGFKDARGNKYGFGYKGGETSQLLFPQGTAEFLDFDDSGRLREEVNHQGQKVSYERDRLGRLIRQSFMGGYTTRKYDTFGQVAETTNENASFRIMYNRFGDVEFIQDGKGRIIRYEYNDKGQRTAMIDPQGKRTTYEYDRRGQLCRIVGPKGASEVYQFEYDLAGRLIRKVFPNGIVSETIYDQGGLLAAASTVDGLGRNLYFMRLGRDRSGNITTLQEINGSWHYEYDPAGRLISAKGPNDYDERFSYDGAGNRVAYEVAGKKHILGYGPLNELLSDGKLQYTYDHDGQPITRSDGTTYQFNAQGQLVAVTTKGGKLVRYFYDPFGRLMAREVDGKRTEYVYDKEDVISEYKNDSWLPAIRYIHGLGIDEPLAYWSEGGLHTYVLGLNNSVRSIVSGDGKSAQQYTLSPFGQILHATGDSKNSYAFNGRRWDGDSELYYFRARFYDPQTGRFISPDPVRFLGGWNLYSYVNNDPINRADPLGLRPIDALPRFITDMIPESIKKATPDAVGITGSVTAGKVLGFKTGLNYQYFGPNDPRNGFYLIGGLGVLWGKNASVTVNVAKNVSDDPALSWGGLFLSPEGGVRNLTGGAFWGVDPTNPTRMDRGWVGFEGGRSKEKKSPLQYIPRNMRNKKSIYSGGITLTNYVHMRWPENNEKMRVVKNQLVPPSVSLGVGETQVFRFDVTLETPPYGKGITTPFDATNVSKWAYIYWDDPNHRFKPCDDPAVCKKNVFTCPKVGDFSIRANYYNEYTIDHADSLSGAYASASITCGKGAGKKAGPKDKILFSKAVYRVREDAGPATITVQRVGSGTGQVSVQYGTQNGTATAGKNPGDGDYDATGGVLVWSNKDTKPKNFYVFVNPDNLVEGSETVLLKLKDVDGNASLGSPKDATLIIEDTENPVITISKTPSVTSIYPGGTVVYTYSVTNPGNCPLHVTIADDKCNPLTFVGGDLNGNGMLDPKETWTYECTFTVPLSASVNLTNTATASGTSPNGNTVSHSDSVTISVTARKVKVPDLHGLNKDAAIYDIKEAALKVGRVEEKKSDQPVGVVIDQSPAPGTLVAADTHVNFTLSGNEARRIFIYPPRETIQLDEEVTNITATLIYKDGKQEELDPSTVTWGPPGLVRWVPGKGMTFTGTEAGTFTITATFGGISGWATYIVEEDWSKGWEPRISDPNDLKANVPLPKPEDYTWYALCNPDTGEVSYGENPDLVKHKVLSGPFPGPTTAAFWIDKNCPRWRCTEYGACATEPAKGGKWAVQCNKGDGSVTIGQDTDTTKYSIMAGGFLGEPDARFWADQNCPFWRCNTDGTCATESAKGGKWAVLCDKDNGSIVLGKDPDPTRYWVMSDGFLGEPDARRWVDQNCPRWQCTEDGACAKGPARGGKWYVLCDRDTGVVALGEDPDRSKYFILDGPFRTESDARYWAQTNCPSWRCDRDGKCLAGAPYRPDAPGGLPPDIGSPPSGSGNVGYYLTKGTMSLAINGTPCTVTTYSCNQCTKEDLEWLFKINEIAKSTFADEINKLHTSSAESSGQESEPECVKTSQVKDMKSIVVKGPSQTPFEVPKPETDCPCKDTPLFQYQIMSEYQPECTSHEELQRMKPMMIDAIQQRQ